MIMADMVQATTTRHIPQTTRFPFIVFFLSCSCFSFIYKYYRPQKHFVKPNCRLRAKIIRI